MAEKVLTVQFRCDEINGECYESIFDDTWTFAQVVNDAAEALGYSGYTADAVLTRNTTTDASSRIIAGAAQVGSEYAAKFSITVKDLEKSRV